MILLNYYRELAPTFMQMTIVFSTNIRMLKKIGNVLNKEISSLWQWFVDNKVSIHFIKDKTKSILFSKAKGLREIIIPFMGNSIKQHETVDYLGRQLDSKIIGKAIKIPVMRKQVFNYSMFLLVCSFQKTLKSNFKKLKASVFLFFINLPPRSHINPSYFRKINWLPTSDRIGYCIADTVFK